MKNNNEFGRMSFNEHLLIFIIFVGRFPLINNVIHTS